MVIGGDGFLGRGIEKSLRRSGKEVITTSRKKQCLSDSCVYLNLAEGVSSWEIPSGVDAAFFCAAITSMEQCRIHPGESRMVNVESTIELAGKLMKKGIPVIFPSTNLVFDGRIPDRKANDSVCPRSEYGRQKTAAETGLMGLGQNVFVVRFSKVIGMQTQFINDWIERLKCRTTIYPFSNMVLAPIPIDFASKVLVEIADSKGFGIWQVSAKEDITYEELARPVARKIGVSQRYVQSMKVCDSEFGLESIPEHTTLDTFRIENELGLKPPDIRETIDSLFG